jgi:hypothetical protein
MRSFRSPAQFIRQLIYGPEPVGQAGAVVLERYSHGQLDGGPLDGFPHFGMTGDPSLSFSGYVASPQLFRGVGGLFGHAKNLSVDEHPALPNSSPPAALPEWLNQLEGIESGPGTG